ncbi:unnamed protein product [Pleuronectes platessa]|uniref:Uncharacterized protein n=1 Tax=Pleuronectes platessa TaxID=8262 RepID=A0A9N7U3I8_PLEPL|nr:unnamed protein product [Pleuronectes platessa]
MSQGDGPERTGTKAWELLRRGGALAAPGQSSEARRGGAVAAQSQSSELGRGSGAQHGSSRAKLARRTSQGQRARAPTSTLDVGQELELHARISDVETPGVVSREPPARSSARSRRCCETTDVENKHGSRDRGWCRAWHREDLRRRNTEDVSQSLRRGAATGAGAGADAAERTTDIEERETSAGRASARGACCLRPETFPGGCGYPQSQAVPSKGFECPHCRLWGAPRRQADPSSTGSSREQPAGELLVSFCCSLPCYAAAQWRNTGSHFRSFYNKLRRLPPDRLLEACCCHDDITGFKNNSGTIYQKEAWAALWIVHRANILQGSTRLLAQEVNTSIEYPASIYTPPPPPPPPALPPSLLSRCRLQIHDINQLAIDGPRPQARRQTHDSDFELGPPAQPQNE